MAKRAPNPKVDWFFSEKKWQAEFVALRSIILDCGLDEKLKWEQPCYTLGEKNVVLIHGFKEYCAVLFFKGALLKDPKKILIQQTKNVQAARQVRFTHVKEVLKLKTVLKEYIKEAIELEKSGKKVKLKKTVDYAMPEEFKAKLNEVPD